MNGRITDHSFAITGMHCSACAMAIDMELEELPGVVEARSSFARATVTVTYDATRVDMTTIITTLGRAGYVARPIPRGDG